MAASVTQCQFSQWWCCWSSNVIEDNINGDHHGDNDGNVDNDDVMMLIMVIT